MFMHHIYVILIEHSHIWNSIGILATSSKPPGPTLTNLRCMATSNATWAFDGAVASRWWCCQWTPFWGTITILTSLIQPTSKIATLAEFHSLEAMIKRQRLPNEECRISSILNQPSWSAPCFFWVPCLGGKVCWASASPWVLSPFGGRLRWAELLPIWSWELDGSWREWRGKRCFRFVLVCIYLGDMVSSLISTNHPYLQKNPFRVKSYQKGWNYQVDMHTSLHYSIGYNQPLVRTCEHVLYNMLNLLIWNFVTLEEYS